MSSLFFFFFLSVCQAMHACNARHLGVVMDDNNVSTKNHLFSTKVVESVKQQKKEEKIISVRSGGCIIFRESDGVKPKDSDKQKREMSAVVSVSGKDLDERSGFFSDYSTPRTRPPPFN